MAEVAAGLIGLFETAKQINDVQRVTGSTTLFWNEVIGTVGILALIKLPWVLGGLNPTREDLTSAILISFATAFLSVFAVVMSVLDVSRTQRRAEAVASDSTCSPLGPGVRGLDRGRDGGGVEVRAAARGRAVAERPHVGERHLERLAGLLALPA